jgi:3-polyprenyl-4-hydroxybenzoate decarboxylase
LTRWPGCGNDKAMTNDPQKILGVLLDATNKLPPETHREWGHKIAMDEDVIRRVTDKWSQLGLPGSGKPIW